MAHLAQLCKNDFIALALIISPTFSTIMIYDGLECRYIATVVPLAFLFPERPYFVVGIKQCCFVNARSELKL